MAADISFRLVDKAHGKAPGELDEQDRIRINQGDGTVVEMTVAEFLSPKGQYLGSGDRSPDNRVSVEGRARILADTLSSMTGNVGFHYSAGRFSPSFQAFVNTRKREDGLLRTFHFENPSEAAAFVQNTVDGFVKQHSGITVNDVLQYNQEIQGGVSADYWNEGTIVRELYLNGTMPASNQQQQGWVDVMLPISGDGKLLI